MEELSFNYSLNFWACLLVCFREHVLFSCPNDLCLDGKTSNSCYISMHVAGASEAATVGKEWTCYSCGSLLVEDVSCRTLSGEIYTKGICDL